MAVKDRIADSLVAIASTVVINLQRKGRSRTDHLTIEVRAVVVIRTV